MNKKNTVKKEQEFSKIINKGNKVLNNIFSIYYDTNDINDYRFGICVGSKIGNAVKRNKIKRQIRAIIDLNKKMYSRGKDYIIIVRRNYINCDFKQANEKFVDLFNKLNKAEDLNYEK